MKQKYAEQDEEERNLKMELLGVIKKETEKENGKTESTPEIERDTQEIKKCYKCGEEGHLSFICPFNAEKTHSDDQEQQNQLKEEEKDEIRQIMQEENIQELEEDEKEKLTELDSLTGKPYQDDVLLFAIPVCAPYNAISNFKFKVKVTPGNTKKGKATKAALFKFLQSVDITQQEKDLLKNVPDNEMIMQMISGVKLQAPGLVSQKKRKK